MKRSLVVDEHQRTTIELSLTCARELKQAAGSALGISPSTTEGSFDITATDTVGTIVTPDIELLIRPKVPLHNVLMLLDVGIGPDAWRAEVFRYGADRDLLPAFASFLSREIDGALTMGLVRAYRSAEEDLLGLRGRIDFKHLHGRAGQAIPMPCRFEEYDIDIPENQLLLTAIKYMRMMAGVPPDSRRALQRSLARLGGVSGNHVDRDTFRRIIFTRLNAHYEPALRLADLAISGATVIDRPGLIGASSFALSMNALFERWLTNRIRRYLDPALSVIPQDRWRLDTDSRITMFPDLVFYDGDRPVYCADIKYKLTSTGRGRSDDYYQLLAYTTATQVDEGLLIYCQAEGDPPPREILVGPAGKRLMTYPLALGGTPEQAESKMRGLVAWIGERIGATLGGQGER